MELKVLDKNGKITETREVVDTVFSRDYSGPLVHQLVESYRANGRGGNRAQKNRSNVKFSTRKPWKQKGTGRARAGRASSPLWRSGGVTFPSSPLENFSKRINKKMYKAGMQCILSQLAREDRLFIIGEPSVKKPKTKELIKELEGYKGAKRLVIPLELGNILELASRNVRDLKVIGSRRVDPVSLLNADVTYVSEGALKNIQESLA
tara:strand:- start:353 stop:973 length:621 start_codon:yes stop_codon:yes gene_type:complete